MKIVVLTAMAAVLVAGSATAADRGTDLDYIRASRCMGIATGVGADTSDLAAYLKFAGANRTPPAVARGDAEFERARRQARYSDVRPRLTAELNTACSGYVVGSRTAVAAGAKTTVVQ